MPLLSKVKLLFPSFMVICHWKTQIIGVTCVDYVYHCPLQSLCAQMMLDRREEEKLCDHLITSAKRRDHFLALRLRDKVLNILANKHGAWGAPETQ